MGDRGKQNLQVEKGIRVRNLDIDFLLRLTEEPQVVSGSEIKLLVDNVITTLRANRGVGRLTDHELMTCNRFILAMWFLFDGCYSMDFDVDSYDIEYIMDENEYMRMGTGRN